MSQLSLQRDIQTADLILSEEQLRAKLNGIIQLTDLMLEHAKKADWDVVESMEVTRKADLFLCFNKTKEISSQELKGALSAIIAQDNQLLELVKEAREKAKFDKLNMNKSIDNVGQYTQASVL